MHARLAGLALSLIVPAVALGSSPASAYTPPAPADLSSLSWTQAFDALVDKMADEYAFTEWKGISWKSLRQKYRPRIVKAQAAGDATAYLLALRAFTHETHDGHVSIRSETGEFEAGVRTQLAGGGFGLIVNRLDSGHVAATWVQRGGPAWRAGIRRGASIVAWDGQPVDEALRSTSTALAPNQPTKWRVDYERERFLVRAPVGAKRTVAFRNPGGSRQRVRLTAVADGEKTLLMTDASSVFSRGMPKDMVTSRTLAGDVGYLRIKAEIDLPPDFPGDHTPTLTQFRQAMRSFRNAPGLIVDIRGNGGGMDQMVADMMSSFYSNKSFYEYQNWIVPGTGRFEIWKTDDMTGAFTRRDAGIRIVPGSKVYAGPIVVLVDNGCISSCEGVAMGLGRLPNARLVGFSGTNGSFGMVGAGVLMPGGQQIGWPFGQSLDKRKVVQIDSRQGVGGVAPDVMVPRTLPTLTRVWTGKDVLLRRAHRMLRAGT